MSRTYRGEKKYKIPQSYNTALRKYGNRDMQEHRVYRDMSFYDTINEVDKVRGGFKFIFKPEVLRDMSDDIYADFHDLFVNFKSSDETIKYVGRSNYIKKYSDINAIFGNDIILTQRDNFNFLQTYHTPERSLYCQNDHPIYSKYYKVPSLNIQNHTVNYYFKFDRFNNKLKNWLYYNKAYTAFFNIKYGAKHILANTIDCTDGSVWVNFGDLLLFQPDVVKKRIAKGFVELPSRIKDSFLFNYSNSWYDTQSKIYAKIQSEKREKTEYKSIKLYNSINSILDIDETKEDDAINSMSWRQITVHALYLSSFLPKSRILEDLDEGDIDYIKNEQFDKHFS